jgi:hypothetical protein
MNELCRVLSLWYFPDTDPKTKVYDLPFRTRSTSIMPIEGHWKGEGDILWRSDMDFPFCIEAKKHEGWDLDGFLSNAGSPIHDWWEQAVTQAEKTQLHPLLLFSRNRRKTYCMMYQHCAARLMLTAGKSSPIFVIRQEGHTERILCLLDDLVRVDPARLINLQ